jgi:hypothetical protein
MRPFILFLIPGVLVFAAIPAMADELTFTLDSYVGSGYPTNLNPDADTCLPPNCVLFTGTLTDNDVDPQPDDSPAFLVVGNPYTGAMDLTDFDGLLSLDNISPPGLLSGDTEYATDGLSNPANTYSGPIFGVDIPVGTLFGSYTDTVYLDITPANGNSPFTVSAQVTVDVVPEPSALSLLLAGFVILTGWFSFRRRGVVGKWHSSES